MAGNDRVWSPGHPPIHRRVEEDDRHACNLGMFLKMIVDFFVLVH
jgi:hypothetical protein